MRSVRVHGTKIAFGDWGDGPPLLLLHGFARDHTVWTAPVESLKGKYRLLVPDLRGMGESRDIPPGALITMEQLADDSAALLDALGIQAAAVAGFSMGGYVLLQMLIRHPSKVRAAAFIGTRASADTPGKKAERLEQNVQLAKEGMEPLARDYVQRLFSRAFSAANPQALEETFRNFASQNPLHIASLNEAMRARGDMTPRLREIRCPCVVIGGTEDRLVAPAAMAALHAELEDSVLDMVEGAGHMLPVETPERVAGALDKLVQRA